MTALRHLSPAMAAAAAALVAGCASGPPDCSNVSARDGGFFGGVGGIVSGDYEYCNQERARRLEDQQDINRGLSRENRALYGETEAARRQRAALQGDVNQLARDTDALKQRASRIQAATSAKQRERANLLGQINQTQAEIGSLNAQIAAGGGDSAALAAKRDALRDKLRRLQNVADALSR